MKASELISKLQAAVASTGDQEIIIAANRHSYMGVQFVSRENGLVLSLYDKIAD